MTGCLQPHAEQGETSGSFIPGFEIDQLIFMGDRNKEKNRRKNPEISEKMPDNTNNM